MEPQIEPQRPSRPQQPQQPRSQRPQNSSPNQQQRQFRKSSEAVAHLPVVRRSYAREVSVVFGITFLVVGLLGFVIPYFLNGHWSYLHNVIFLVAGAMAVWFGVRSELAARRFAYIAGAFFTIMGLLGYIGGVPGEATIANPVRDDFMWNFIPGVLELGSADHSIHLIAGVILLIGAAMKFKSRARRDILDT
ncbi:DUF4383 domain-containing protein [Bdellovibrio sp. NC01]|uniref:DUF4383 domain-containing protein n=1 Tax=Bdellovibrio sp. NC01 TaxID=2220073 RepID=UPI00115BCF3F|nr:DUF4383 domain-containing protein [Bdellovibrio sp. NC01]QDK36124.1 hypothetical protein DOE51_00155 [Bdellovibrio sp. NC01]